MPWLKSRSHLARSACPFSSTLAPERRVFLGVFFILSAILVAGCAEQSTDHVKITMTSDGELIHEVFTTTFAVGASPPEHSLVKALRNARNSMQTCVASGGPGAGEAQSSLDEIDGLMPEGGSTSDEAFQAGAHQALDDAYDSALACGLADPSVPISPAWVATWWFISSP